jgi:hypothetical protein
MKHQKMINFAAGMTLVAGPLTAMAVEFGGGWKLDKNTGTLYNPHHAPIEKQIATAPRKSHKNSFGGGLVQDPLTGTTYNATREPLETTQPSKAGDMHTKSHKNTFGGGLVQDSMTGTTYNHNAGV